MCWSMFRPMWLRPMWPMYGTICSYPSRVSPMQWEISFPTTMIKNENLISNFLLVLLWLQILVCNMLSFRKEVSLGANFRLGLKKIPSSVPCQSTGLRSGYGLWCHCVWVGQGFGDFLDLCEKILANCPGAVLPLQVEFCNLHPNLSAMLRFLSMLYVLQCNDSW
jgi:hypothetical protein